MKHLFLDKSSKYRITGVTLLVILGFIVIDSLRGPFSFAASHAPNFCDSYQGSVQGVSNFNTTCHQLVDPLNQDEKTMLQDSTFVTRLQAYITNATTLPTHTSAAGRHILVQLLEHGGNAIPCRNGDPFPAWTLYGDGILIFSKQGYCGPLQQAQLTFSDVKKILGFIVNQNDFFASSQKTYGQSVPDIGSTDLLVSTNGQQKTITLFQEGSFLQGTPDVQTQHVFAIAHFLEGYHPANARPYVPTATVIGSSPS